MSADEKGFLARWSERKREAARNENKSESEPKPAPPDAPVSEPPPAETPASETEPSFDLASLPKLEDLTADTDLTVFFKKGVPESIRNAALRKSWALDPAIRNYVNPALDYAYDWNTPGRASSRRARTSRGWSRRSWAGSSQRGRQSLGRARWMIRPLRSLTMCVNLTRRLSPSG
jgi:Protein of unknown function (DUF3306)